MLSGSQGGMSECQLTVGTSTGAMVIIAKFKIIRHSICLRQCSARVAGEDLWCSLVALAFVAIGSCRLDAPSPALNGLTDNCCFALAMENTVVAAYRTLRGQFDQAVFRQFNKAFTNRWRDTLKRTDHKLFDNGACAIRQMTMSR